MSFEETIALIKNALEDKKATDIKAYDVRGISGLTDCFIVATGTAAPHLKALVAGVEGDMKKAGTAAFRVSGEPESGWIVVDFVDVVVHVFSPEARVYYGIEKLWQKAAPL